MIRSELERLSREELIELVLRLQQPAKTSATSSKPPSSDPKERRENAKPGGAKPGHEGHSRRLGDVADRIEDHHPDICPRCQAPLPPELAGTVIGEYDTVELPPVAPVLTRHRRFAALCPCCGAEAKARLPAAAKGTPFGPRIHALAVYFKTFQSVGRRM